MELDESPHGHSGAAIDLAWTRRRQTLLLAVLGIEQVHRVENLHPKLLSLGGYDPQGAAPHAMHVRQEFTWPRGG